MYRTAYQSGLLTIFYSCGSKPLEIWDVIIKDGMISRFIDQEIKSMVLDIRGTNISTTYMVCPSKNRILGISMPFLIMIVKNLKKYFSFEVTILDSTGARRRFRVSNFQSTTQIMPMCTAMPIALTDGWNQIQFNLAEFTRRAYDKQFAEVQKLKINANIRLRRIYFAQRIVPDEELPPEFKLFFPLAKKSDKPRKIKEDKENIKPADKNEVEDYTKKDEMESRSKAQLAKLPSKTELKRTSAAAESTAGAGQAEATPGKSEATSEVAAPAKGENTAVTTEIGTPAEAVVETPTETAEPPPAETQEGLPVETVEEQVADVVEEPLAEIVEEAAAETGTEKPPEEPPV